MHSMTFLLGLAKKTKFLDKRVTYIFKLFVFFLHFTSDSGFKSFEFPVFVGRKCILKEARYKSMH